MPFSSCETLEDSGEKTPKLLNTEDFIFTNHNLFLPCPDLFFSWKERFYFLEINILEINISIPQK